MPTWNDVSVERLFNNSGFRNGSFNLPEGYGKPENYSKVISLFRMLQDVDFEVVLDLDQTAKSLWRAIKSGTQTRGTGDSPEQAIQNLLKGE